MKRHVCLAALALFVFSGIAVAQTPSSPVNGTWQMSCTTKKGVTRQLTLQIEQSGTVLSGSISAGGQSGKLSGNMNGAQVSLSGGPFSFSGSVSGNTISGQNQRGRPCTATRG